jgi:hypothetical protein
MNEQENGSIPDSGAKRTFASGAQRDCDKLKPALSLIPPEALRRMGERYTEGARKYGRNNWREGMPLSAFCDSALRHVLAASEGDVSEDHLGAALWNLAGWIDTERRIRLGALPPELDDLPFGDGDDFVRELKNIEGEVVSTVKIGNPVAEGRRLKQAPDTTGDRLPGFVTTKGEAA